MRRKNWLLLIVLLALPLVAAAGLASGQTLIGLDQPQTSAGFVCPLTGEILPCPDCCPLNQASRTPVQPAAAPMPLPVDERTPAKPFICPLTGEELPCPDCCPLNRTPSDNPTEK